MKYYDSETLLFLDGRFQKAAESKIDLYGQSLHYGLSAFEGMRAYKTHNGTRIFKAKKHFDRLEQSCKLAGIPFIWNKNTLIKKCYNLLEINNLKDAYIRPLVFCPPHMKIGQPQSASIMICAWAWDSYMSRKQLQVSISSYEKNNPKSVPAEAKLSGTYVNAIIASSQAQQRGFDEAILLDMNGNIAEAASANIFIEKHGKLYTPEKGHILPGITRQTVMELGKILDIEVIEKALSPQELHEADAAFLSGTAVEIMQVSAVDDTVFKMPWRESLGYVMQRAYQNLVLEKVNYEVII